MADFVANVNRILKEYADNVNDEREEIVKKELLKQSKIVEDLILSRWRTYLKSYKPTMYKRTGMTEAGINRSGDVDRNGKFLETSVEFLDDFMYHTFAPQNEEGYVDQQRHSFKMIDSGWKDSAMEEAYGMRVYRLTYYQGYGISNWVIDRYNATKPDFIKLRFEWEGQNYIGKGDGTFTDDE